MRVSLSKRANGKDSRRRPALARRLNFGGYLGITLVGVDGPDPQRRLRRRLSKAGREAGSKLAALREGVVLAPGNVFSPSRSTSEFMRFNMAQMVDPRVFAVLSRTLAGGH